MAVTKIIPVRTSIEKSVEYICNPNKTDGSLLIYSEHCFPQTAALTFQHHLSQCRAGWNTIGRHLIQSFAPGEVDANTAHEIGKKLAGEILNGDYTYVLATHVDRGHIHNHFVWGAGNIATHKRYRSNKNTYPLKVLACTLYDFCSLLKATVNHLLLGLAVTQLS